MKKADNNNQRIQELELLLQKERTQNNHANAIIEGSALIIWTVDSNFELLNFNQNYFDYLQINDAKARVSYYNKGVVKSLSSDSFWKRNYKKALQGKAINLEISLDYYDKGQVWKSIFLNPIYNNNGSIKAVSGLAYDITEKMQSRISLIESEQKFRHIFESFQDIYFRCDLEGKVTMISPSSFDKTGYSKSEIIGSSIGKFIESEFTMSSILAELQEKVSLYNLEITLKHKTGKSMSYICNLKLISQNNTKPYIQGVAHDISELKKATKQLKRSKNIAEKSLKVKERFLANMSHEIRTPLNGIMGMLHLLEKSGMDKKQQEHLTALRGSSEILMNTLNDLLDMSKIDAGKMELRPSIMSPKSMLEKLSLLYNEQIKQNGLSIKVVLDDNVPNYLLTDETKLIQIYSNLISNAIKFTRPGGKITIDLRLDQTPSADELVLFGSVKDNGLGISKKDQKKLFKSFSQLDSSISKTFKGTGLGLNICRKLVKLFGGKISVESEPDKGSLFSFTFKAHRAFVRDSSSESNILTLPQELNILIVDDNKINLQLAGQLILNSGAKATCVNDGATAIEYCKDEKYDVILMDIQMPEMDGNETSKRIRLNQRNKNTPILAMTAYDKSTSKRYKVMDDFIAKPIEPELLFHKIVKWTTGQPQEVITHQNGTSDLLTINTKTLEKLAKYGGEEMVKESLDEFLNECENQVKQCKEALIQNNPSTIEMIMHTLKGNAGTLGAEKIADWAEWMENEVKRKKNPTFDSCLAQLEKLIHEFKITLTKITTT